MDENTRGCFQHYDMPTDIATHLTELVGLARIVPHVEGAFDLPGAVGFHSLRIEEREGREAS